MHLDGYWIDKKGDVLQLPKGCDHISYAISILKMGMGDAFKAGFVRVRFFGGCNVETFVVECSGRLTSKQRKAVSQVYRPVQAVLVETIKSVNEKELNRRITKEELSEMLR